MHFNCHHALFGLCFCLTFFACRSEPEPPVATPLALQCRALPSIDGPGDYRSSPFVTAGDRLYLVGHQDGYFPDLGWHVAGEMGGVWAHPIKLMDGFSASLQKDNTPAPDCLPPAERFTNYPPAGQHFYDLRELDAQVWRTQFVPDGLPGLVVEYLIANQSAEPARFTFRFNGMTDLRPVWLGERTGMTDAPDTLNFVEELSAYHARDSRNDWHLFFGAGRPADAHSTVPGACVFEHRGQGRDAYLEYTLELPAGGQEPLVFFIAGSDENQPQAVKTYQTLRKNYQALFKEKMARYEAIRQTAALELPDEKISRMYEWTRYGTDWLAFTIPGIGQGVAAGIPDYPWYFGCDQTYTARGLLHSGFLPLATGIMETLLEVSDEHNGNGRIVHEVSTNGAVYNAGNINETPHFIATAWEVFKWTADTAFLQRAYRQAQQGLAWLEQQDADGNGYPDGHGMMEIRGMDSEMIDVVVYTQEAYAAAARMAEVMGEPETGRLYQEKADRLALKINTEWWVAEEDSYADFRANKAKATELLNDAIVRADTLDKPWSEVELREIQKRLRQAPDTGTAGYAFYHNWVVNTPLETGVADTTKALRALDTGRRYLNPFGVYVTGIDRKEEEEDPDSFAAAKQKETFNYTGAVMTLPTGVQAIAAARYGRSDEALDYLQRLARSFSYAAPGSMYEVSPDYGMLVQAWNIYSVATPIVGYFLGIQPQAHLRQIVIRPRLPAAWTEAAIDRLPVGNNELSFSIENNRYQIDQRKADWELILEVPAGNSYRLNGKEAAPEWVVDGRAGFLLKGKENSLEVVR